MVRLGEAVAIGCAACVTAVVLRRLLREHLTQQWSAEERAVREDLAAAHTLSAHFGFDEFAGTGLEHALDKLLVSSTGL